MNAKTALMEILALPEEDRRWLVEEIAASLPEQAADLGLSAAKLAELHQRIAEHEADPNSGIPWEEAKAQVLAKLHK